MRNKQPKPGQNGRYWLDKKAGRSGPDDPWCVTWYDKPKRQTRYHSLGTADVQEASTLLAKWVALNERPLNGDPHHVQLDRILLTYWEDYAQHVASARITKMYLARWQEFWAGRVVSDITPNEQRRFREWLGEGRLAPSTIDKILSVGRAAMLRAVKYQELTSAPHIFQIETRERKRSRKPLGRPITIEQAATFIDAIRHRNLMVLVLLCANTLGRPAALYDLRRLQFDSENLLVNLNPPGRVQTKKFRPILPVSRTLRPWLAAETDPNAYLITYHGKRVGGLHGVWSHTVSEAKLPADITPYSFRHGISRELRKRRVPEDEISLFLGHTVPGASETTELYAPYTPDYCKNAVAAVDEIMSEVRALLRRNSIDDPSASFDGWGQTLYKKLNETQTKALHECILRGVKNAELEKKFGITRAAIRKHRLKLGCPPTLRAGRVPES